MIRNLYEETKEILKYYRKTIDDVTLVCGEQFAISKNTYVRLAARTFYNDMYQSGQCVAKDLMLIGKDFIMHRDFDDDDGSEGWMFFKVPLDLIPTNTKRIKEMPISIISAIIGKNSCLALCGKTLADLNMEE